MSAAAAPGKALPGGPWQLVVMGVCGCGKSSVGRQLADELGLAFLEGDELHSPRNVALMAAGTALKDADRADWLSAIADRLGQALAAGQGLVVSCSALKRAYRDLLRAACPGLRFIYLHGATDLLRLRLQQRQGHYMPPALLDSQLAALEPPGSDESAIFIDISPPSTEVAALALHWLQDQHA